MYFSQDFKSCILDSEFPSIDKILSYEGFLFSTGLLEVPSWCKYQTEQELKEASIYYWSKYPNEMQCASQINSALKQRLIRMKKRVTNIISEPSLFLTLTFTNDSLERLSDKTRRRYVQDYLRSLGCQYVANIDFGSKNGREHYHSLVQIERVDPHGYGLGALNFEVVRGTGISDCIGLSKYITKLSYHALKGTTKFNRVIYSRNK